MAELDVVLLNGPLGCGKSTLGELLAESVEGCVFLDGDALTVLNPPPADELAALHRTVALLVSHHMGSGYTKFVISHAWQTKDQIADLEARLANVAPKVSLRALLLTLPRDENLKRIEGRRRFRAIDETAHEDVHFEREYRVFAGRNDARLGTPFDASAPAGELARRARKLLGWS